MPTNITYVITEDTQMFVDLPEFETTNNDNCGYTIQYYSWVWSERDSSLAMEQRESMPDEYFTLWGDDP